MGKTTTVKTDKPKSKKDKPKKITIVNNASRIVNLSHPQGLLALAPGPNAVDRHLFEQSLKKHPTFVKYCNTSLGHKTLKKDVPAILTLDESGPPSTVGKEPEDAVELVEAVCEPDLLYKIESEDSRPEVRQAVDERRAKIGPTAELTKD